MREAVECEADGVLISQIAGRHLVFDRRHIAFLRRHHATCGILVGTVPQSPTQNVFLGVPLELSAEDALVLVENGVARLRAEAPFQLGIFDGSDIGGRREYITTLQCSRKGVEARMGLELAKKQHLSNVRNGPIAEPDSTRTSAPDRTAPTPQIVDQPLVPGSRQTTRRASCATTFTCFESRASLPLPNSGLFTSAPLMRQLRADGYYMTPGLRFGAQLSVYPGDPLRFHAHYLANQYDWEDKIPLLDVVSGGRLSTTVKKGFLIGGGDTRPGSQLDTGRIFCIEWAGM